MLCVLLRGEAFADHRELLTDGAVYALGRCRFSEARLVSCFARAPLLKYSPWQTRNRQEMMAVPRPGGAWMRWKAFDTGSSGVTLGGREETFGLCSQSKT